MRKIHKMLLIVKAVRYMVFEIFSLYFCMFEIFS